MGVARSRRPAWRAGALAAAIVAASPVASLAQNGWVAPPAATTVAPLTVTARPPPLTGAALDRATDRLVYDRTVPTRVGRLARWRMPICPETIGLGDALDAEVTARILQVGQAIGAPPRAQGVCLANIEIVFTPYPQLLMNRVKSRRWMMLGYHYASQTKALATVTRPVQAWWATGTRSTANSAAGAMMFGGAGSVSATGAGELALDDAQSLAPSGAGEGRFDTSLSSEFANVLIVVDQSRVAGASTRAIADYAAMLAFSQANHLQTCGPLPSILDLYSEDCPAARRPEGLTQTDLAYLKALYAVDTRVSASVARGELAHRIEATLRGR